jgi:thiol-disulfide isomerase/thioredoxin
MKKLYTLFLLTLLAGCINAQPKNTAIPPYKILTTDSVYVTPANLHKNKPTIVIYFSPDCTHCQHLMMEMNEQAKSFSKAQIVMITFAQYRAIKNFYRDFGLSKYPSITVGTEGRTYLVQTYYNVRMTPFIAVYNRKGVLIKDFEKVPKMDELIATLKKG